MCLTAQDEERRGQKWSLLGQADSGLDKPGLLLATPPHWPVKIKEERPGQNEPLHPQGTHLWEMGGAAGQGAPQQAPGLARESLSWMRTWSSLCPPLLGPGGPSQQASFLSSRQAELDQGHPHASLIVSLSLNSRTEESGGVGGWGNTSSRSTHLEEEGRRRRACARRSWLRFPILLCDFVGILADSPPE